MNSAFWLNSFGFLATLVPCLIQKWNLPEFCWSTWLAAFFFSSCCVCSGIIRVVAMNVDKTSLEKRFPPLRKLPVPVFRILWPLLLLLGGVILLRIYLFLFSFYGIFLSVFAEMEPSRFFGRNGFINSDFFGPVRYLAARSWPMVAGLLLSNATLLVKESPLKLLVEPFRSGAIARIHVFVVLMPFLCLLAWVLFKESYQPVTLVLLNALLYYWPARR